LKIVIHEQETVDIESKYLDIQYYDTPDKKRET